MPATLIAFAGGTIRAIEVNPLLQDAHYSMMCRRRTSCSGVRAVSSRGPSSCIAKLFAMCKFLRRQRCYRRRQITQHSLVRT